jgi:hypothetical protein
MRAIVFCQKIQNNVNHTNEFYTAQQYKQYACNVIY